MTRLQIQLITLIMAVLLSTASFFSPTKTVDVSISPTPTPTPDVSLQSGEELLGVWKMTIESQPDKAIPKQERIFIFIKKDSNKNNEAEFIVKDALTNKKLEGIKDNDSIQFKSLLLYSDNTSKAIFTGSLNENNSLTGTATVKDTSLSWEAVKVDNLIWTCTNHNPRHSATNSEEMKRLTKEKGCDQWTLLQ